MVDVAIVGAGPYGLSMAAHLRRAGVPFRIFGRPMDSWQSHMPKGMMLKSDGFASTIDDPDQKLTLKQFCADRGINYADLGVPVSLDTFVAFGLAFKGQLLPEIENKLVADIEQFVGGFTLTLEDGEKVKARQVVLAIGITHFQHVPTNLARLPARFVSHSFQHSDLEPFRGRRVVVVGGGASATDIAGLLHESGAKVQLVARDRKLNFHNKPNPNQRRSWWQRLRHPQSGLGPSLRSRFFCDAPHWFHRLPAGLRLKIVKKHLGPSGGWFVKDMVIGKVPLMLGCTVEKADIQGEHVCLKLRGVDGTPHEIVADHIICATGYRVDVNRLKFLNPKVRSELKTLEGSPVLSVNFESTMRGLYFVGVAAATSFGPLMRFAFGARYTARRLTRVLANARVYTRASVTSPNVVRAAE
ncbi:MAG: NAD(P)-binding domain-containing protein [Candidatus Acidiferrales bacterium]